MEEQIIAMETRRKIIFFQLKQGKIRSCFIFKRTIFSPQFTVPVMDVQIQIF